jgi:hypothetical protein
MGETMPRKPKPKWDDPEQSKRFLEAAERAEASNDPKDLDRALKKIAPRTVAAQPKRPPRP